MANKWNIPVWLEKKVKSRDKVCVYCSAEFRNNFHDRATWEHIDNNGSNVCEENITLCCNSCNASKGSKRLADWLKTVYCVKKKINNKTVAPVIKTYIKNNKE